MSFAQSVRIGLLVVVAAAAIACASFHRVTDPQTGNVYYTDDIEHLDSGAVEFTDGKTGARVSLPSSEVAEINEEEFKANTPPKE